MSRTSLSRRSFVATAGAAGLVGASGLALPFYSRANARPAFTHGVQSGDVDTESGMIWARADRPSRVTFEISTTESFANATRLPPLAALPESDFTVKRLLTDLASDQDMFYRMTLVDLSDINAVSEPIVGRFRTAPASKRNVRFAWSGDTAGQGWGIDETGMLTYATIAKHTPDFFLHSGDTIYADGVMKDEVELPGGGKWVNKVLIDSKRKVAETLERISRPVEIQSDGRALPRAQRGLPDLLPMGRSRGHQQLVVVEGPVQGRPLHREVGRAAVGARRPRLPRDDADPLHAGRARPRLPQDRLRPAARRVLPRPALLSRPQRPGHGGDADAAIAHSRRGAGQVAEA